MFVHRPKRYLVGIIQHFQQSGTGSALDRFDMKLSDCDRFQQFSSAYIPLPRYWL